MHDEIYLFVSSSSFSFWTSISWKFISMDVNASSSNHHRPPLIIRSISSAPTTPTNSYRFRKEKENKTRISSYETSVMNRIVLDVRRSILQRNPSKNTSITEVENLRTKKQRNIVFFFDRRNQRILSFSFRQVNNLN